MKSHVNVWGREPVLGESLASIVWDYVGAALDLRLRDKIAPPLSAAQALASVKTYT